MNPQVLPMNPQVLPFGVLLRMRREEAHLSRATVAKQSKLSEATIKLIESHRTRPTRTTLLALQSVPALRLQEEDMPPEFQDSRRTYLLHEEPLRKELDKQYRQAQLDRAGRPGPKAIGIDEISIRKGHTYRIVVSDLIRRRPIWFGGEDRSEASMNQFYDWLGEKKVRGIRLAVMDMWKPFHNATTKRAPQAAILYDKFHVMRHLNEALDKKAAYRDEGGAAPPTGTVPTR